MSKTEQKVDAQLASSDVFAQYPEDAQGIVKNALMEACYVRFGDDPNITNVGAYFNSASKEHSIEVTVDQFLSVSLNPEKMLENYKLSHPEFDLEGAKLKLTELGHDMEVGKVFSSLMKEVDALKNAIEKATDNRQNFINQRAEEIANTGPLKRFFGGGPKPIPSIKEMPLTRDDIEKYIKPELCTSESLQRLLTAQLENTTIVLGEKNGVLKEVVNSSLGLGEAAAVTVHNAGWDMTAAASALGYGLLQLTKEGSIEDATRVAKESYKLFSEQSHHEMSANAKKTVDENYVLQGASYALGKTVVPVVEALNDTLPEPVTVFGGLALSAIPSGKSLVAKRSFASKLTLEMENKILAGQRIVASNKIIGGHSPSINNSNPKYAVELRNINLDQTRSVKFLTQFDDGNLSKIKTSTLFPEHWQDSKIIQSIKEIGDEPPMGKRSSTGETLHRGIVDGVEIDVIKIGDDITAGYPVGGKPTPGFNPI